MAATPVAMATTRAALEADLRRAQVAGLRAEGEQLPMMKRTGVDLRPITMNRSKETKLPRVAMYV